MGPQEGPDWSYEKGISVVIKSVIDRQQQRRQVQAYGKPDLARDLHQLQHRYHLINYLRASKARFSSSTLTPGSPIKPSHRPWVFWATRSRTLTGSRPRALATRATC
jgi:hypothetical protein